VGRLGELSDEEIERDGTNPILHITVHRIIENQIALGEPEETGRTVEALVQQGLARHEAIHRVGNALAEEIYHILKDRRPSTNQVSSANCNNSSPAQRARPHILAKRRTHQTPGQRKIS